MVEETLQGGRGAIDRQRELLAHHSDGEINVFHAAQDVGHEIAALEAFCVTPVGHLVVGGAVDVIEYWTGQPSPGQTPEIMKVVAVAQMHACSPPNRFKCSATLASQRPRIQPLKSSARVSRNLSARHVRIWHIASNEARAQDVRNVGMSGLTPTPNRRE